MSSDVLDIFFFYLFRFTGFLIFLLVCWSIHVLRFLTVCLNVLPAPSLSFPIFISNLSLQDDYFCYQAVLLKEGVPQMLIEVLKRCFEATDSDGKQFSDQLNSVKIGSTLTSWCLPVFKSFSLLCCSQTPMQHPGRHDLWVDAIYYVLFSFLFFFPLWSIQCVDWIFLLFTRYKFDNLSADDCSLILPHILKFCQVLSPLKSESILSFVYCSISSLSFFFKRHIFKS